LAATLLVALAVVLGLVIALIAGLVLLLRESERALVRLDQLEAAFPADVGAIGLPVGAPAPNFELPDTAGENVDLDDLLEPGLPVVLVFTDPNCGPCREILPLVADWQRERGDQLTIAVLSEGDSETTAAKQAELGLRSVLVQHEREVAEAYESWGTPTAVLISPEGLIASPLGTGSNGVHDLVAGLLNVDANRKEVLVHG
jgi:peroxiredoxin